MASVTVNMHATVMMADVDSNVRNNTASKHFPMEPRRDASALVLQQSMQTTRRNNCAPVVLRRN